MRARLAGSVGRPSSSFRSSWADEGGPRRAINHPDGLLRSEAGGVAPTTRHGTARVARRRGRSMVAVPQGAAMVRWLRRVGLASSPKALGVLAAAVLIAALVLTGRVLNDSSRSGGRPPAGSSSMLAGTANTQADFRIGGRVECPLLWPVLAMSDHTSYPDGHPTRPPPSATPVACYQTTASAANAGYAPAPLPAGRRPAWLRGPLPGAAAHRAARLAATAAVRRAGHLPARAGAAVPPGWVRGPTRLRRRSGRLRRPFDRRDADP